MDRLTQIADFGFEDWEEILYFVKSDLNGAYNIIDIARFQGKKEFDEILKNISLRLAAYEDTGLEPHEIERILDNYDRGLTPSDIPTLDQWLGRDDFCSYGERKESNE